MDEYNGSAVVAMAGSSCVGLASDRRLGVNRFNTISNEFDKCFRINPQCFVAFPGLATDVQTMHKELQFRCNLFSLREDVAATDFVCNGTAKEQLAGICEAMWRPDMNEEELMETLSQCLLAGVDRDCVSGWGGVVHVMTPEKIITRHLKGRMD